jgi:hypothetical protein
MLLKLLLLALLGLVVFGGGRRVLGLAQSLKRVPEQLKEGTARAEDPVPFAKEVRGVVREPDARD